jgi:hypothetical protein
VVIYLDVEDPFSESTHQVLVEVPGMKLRRFNYQWHVRVLLQDVLQAHLPYLTELCLTNPPIRQEEYMALSRLLDPSSRRMAAAATAEERGNASAVVGGIRSLKIRRCNVGRTVLSEFARSCGPTLQSLEIRKQEWAFQLQESHGLFPEDGPRDWLRPVQYDAAVGDGSFGWQPCVKCEINIRGSSKGHVLSHLLAGPDSTLDSTHDSEDLTMAETESRMDLALLDMARSHSKSLRS